MYRQVEQLLTDAQDAHILGAASLRNWLHSLSLDEVSPPDSTALVTAVSIPSNVRLETSRLGPKMTGPARTEDCRGMILQQIASIYRGLAFIYRQIAFFQRQIAFIHQPISIYPHLRHRAFPRSPEGARTSREQ